MNRSGHEVSLRIAGKPDVPALLTLMEPFNRFEQTPWDPVAKKRALENLLSDQSLGVIGMLEAARQPIGYFVVTWGYDLEWDGRDAFLTELFLIPEARGRRWGRHAMALVESVAREHGARALHLMVRHENVIARRLYARQGYVSPPRIFLTKQLQGS